MVPHNPTPLCDEAISYEHAVQLEADLKTLAEQGKKQFKEAIDSPGP